MWGMTTAVLMAATALAVPANHRSWQADLDALVAAGPPGAVLTVRHGERTQRYASGYADPVAGQEMRVGDRIWGRHAHGFLGDQDLTGIYPWAWAASGLTSTADDSAVFYRALFAGRLLGPRMMREMTRTIEVTDSDLPSRSGLGVQRWTPCGVAWGHSGNTPGYLVYTWISPDTRHEVVLMMNEDPQSAGAGNAVFESLLQRAFCAR